MIQQFREFTKGWVAFVIFTAVALTFVLWGVGSYLGSRGQHAGDAATVYGSRISVSDVAQLANAKQVSSAAALNALIQQKVWEHNFPNVSFDELKKVSRITFSPLPDDALFFTQWLSKQAHLRYVRLPSSAFSVNKEPSTDKQMKQYYQSHQDEFKVPSQQQFQYALIDFAKTIKSSINVTPAEIKEYYNGNKFQYVKSPAAWKVEVLSAQFSDEKKQKALLDKCASWLSSGGVKDAAAFVKKNQDWQLKSDSKDLTQMTKLGLMDLQKGGWSSPRVVGGEVVAYQLEDKVAPTFKSESEVSADIKSHLSGQQVSDLESRLVAKLRQAGLSAPGALPAEVSISVGGKDHKIKLESTLTGFMEKGNYQGTRFSDAAVGDVMKSSADQINAGDVAPPVVLADKSILVFRLKQSKPAHVQSYDEVRSIIAGKLQDLRVKKEMEDFAQGIEKQVTAKVGDTQINAELKKKGLTWETYKINSDIEKYMFSLFIRQEFGLSSEVAPVWPSDQKGSPDLKVVLNNIGVISEGVDVGHFTVSGSDDVILVQRLPSHEAVKLTPKMQMWLSQQMADLLFYGQWNALLSDTFERANEKGDIKKFVNFS